MNLYNFKDPSTEMEYWADFVMTKDFLIAPGCSLSSWASASSKISSRCSTVRPIVYGQLMKEDRHYYFLKDGYITVKRKEYREVCGNKEEWVFSNISKAAHDYWKSKLTVEDDKEGTFYGYTLIMENMPEELQEYLKAEAVLNCL